MKTLPELKSDRLALLERLEQLTERGALDWGESFRGQTHAVDSLWLHEGMTVHEILHQLTQKGWSPWDVQLRIEINYDYDNANGTPMLDWYQPYTEEEIQALVASRSATLKQQNGYGEVGSIRRQLEILDSQIVRLVTQS